MSNYEATLIALDEYNDYFTSVRLCLVCACELEYDNFYSICFDCAELSNVQKTKNPPVDD